MNVSFTRGTLCVAFSLASLTACAGSNDGGVPSSMAPASQSADAQMRADASRAELSGQYTGTEKLHGVSYPVTESLVQYGSALGGDKSTKFASQTVTGQITFSVHGTALKGTGVFLSGTSYCTYAEKATYDSKTHKLSGSFKAISGCTGETGSYTVKQNCFYKDNSAEDIRPAFHPC